MARSKKAQTAQAAPAETPESGINVSRVADGCIEASYDGASVRVVKIPGENCSCTLDLAKMPLASAKRISKVLSAIVGQAR